MENTENPFASTESNNLVNTQISNIMEERQNSFEATASDAPVYAADLSDNRSLKVPKRRSKANVGVP